MAAPTVVEDLEVFEDCAGEFDACSPALSVEQLDLHPTPEGSAPKTVDSLLVQL
jgi:hypothetical protein